MSTKQQKIIFRQKINKLKNLLKLNNLGSLQESFIEDNSNKLILIFRDNPENWSVRWSIAKILCDIKNFDLVFQLGHNGFLQDSGGLVLLKTIPDKDIKEKTAIYFLRKYALHPAEYANALNDGDINIQLCGAECMKLYKKAQKLFRKQSKFIPHQIERAKAIVDNMFYHIEDQKKSMAALICDADIPDLVSEELLKKGGAAYAIIRPQMTYPSGKSLYLMMLQDKGKKILNDESILNDPDELPPPPVNFKDKEIDDMKEKMRITLTSLIESNKLLTKLGHSLEVVFYNKIGRIIRSTEGIKTKVVLIKAVFMEMVEQVSNNGIFKWEMKIGILGLLATLVGVIFGFVETARWYQILVLSCFGTSFIIARILYRKISSYRWLLHILGFIVGYFVFGKWGILIGVFSAAYFGLKWALNEEAMATVKPENVAKTKRILLGEE
jgi:hypothetical protein